MEEQIDDKGDSDHIVILPFLKSLIKASQDLQQSSNPLHFFSYCSSSGFSSIETFLSQAEILPLNRPNFSKLTLLLCNLKSLLCSQKASQGYSINCVLYRHFISYKIYLASVAIEKEIQVYFDRELVRNLVDTLGDDKEGFEIQGKVNIVKDLEKRLSRGFDGNLQEVILKGKVFNLLELLISEPRCDKRLREQAADCVLAMVKFNKDVFVGLVLMGPIIRELILMSSCSSIRVLCSLIRLIRTPLIDEMESRGDIPLIVDILDARSTYLRARGVDCIYEIVYSGRKEVVKTLLDLRVVEKLVQLQRLTSTAVRIDDHRDAFDSTAETEAKDGHNASEDSPFWSCVQRFSIQVEVGEGLSREEKKDLKSEILQRIREASVSEIEAASLIAEVLWGSSP